MSLAPIPTCSSLQQWQMCFDYAPPTLNTLRRAFTALLKYAFSDPSRFDGYEDALSCLTYSDNPVQRKINISASTSIDPGDSELIPGIMVSLSEGVKFTKDFITPESSMSQDFASFTNSAMARTSIAISCRHHDADISCVMADLVMLFMFSIRTKLFETWGWLRDFQLVAQSEPKQIALAEGDISKCYESSVVIQLDYEYSTYVTRESKRLKDYSLDATPPTDS